MQQIVDAIRNKTCVLFAGAGLSRDAGLPDWLGFCQRLKEELSRDGKLPPDCLSVLNTLLAERARVPLAIELILGVARRTDVVRAVRAILNPTKDSQVHRVIGELSVRGAVTTNYDRVLDGVFPADSYRLSNSRAHLKVVPTAVASGAKFLLKIHGDIDDQLDPSDPLVARGAPFMVLSKGDFAALIQGERGEGIVLALHSILQENSVLFLGYSFSDPDVSWMLRFLSEQCQFMHPSWYVGLKGQPLPDLPYNVTGISVLDTWESLGSWLSHLSNALRESRAAMEKEPTPTVPTPHVLSDEERRAYLALTRHLTDLESNDLAERVLASALLEEISQQPDFSFEWLSGRVRAFLEVGPALGEALAHGTIRYLTQLKLVEQRPDGRFRAIANATQTLLRRAAAGWERDRSEFYTSIARKLSPRDSPMSPDFTQALDAILLALCVRFGQAMAQWVHRGVGRELGWEHVKEMIRTHLMDREEIRKAEAVFDLILRQPADEEVPYLYRLLGAAFLANSVRLDPSAANVLKAALSSYELYLDTNVLLPIVIDDHVDHRAMNAIIQDSRDAGVKLLVLQCVFDELSAHRDVASRTVYECREDLSRLSELVTVLGMRANCFIQGYLNILSISKDDKAAGSKQTKGITWKQYLERYTDSNLGERLEQLGIKIVGSYERARAGSEYNEILAAIAREWERKLGFERAPVLNENEAEQFCYIYHRRGELASTDSIPHVWFLSYETVLAKVFEKHPGRWGTPPTFPFSAWVAFLDSRLPWTPKDPSAIVNAILKGHSAAFDLPDPIALVRAKAFGERVTSRDEEEALQVALSGFTLIKRVEKARSAVLSRARLADATRESSEARKAAVAEISTALDEQIVRLREELSKKGAVLHEVEARFHQQRQELESLKAQIGKGTKRPPRKKHRYRK